MQNIINGQGDGIPYLCGNNISPAKETYQGKELYPESLSYEIKILKID